MDLRAVAGRQPRSAIKEIAQHTPGSGRVPATDAQALARIILRQGARIESDADRPLFEALQIAASQPEQDAAAFTCATAVLIADRLQHGLGDDDLGSYWAEFGPDYDRLAAPDRAAIVQGFLIGARQRRLRMPAAPTADAGRLSRPLAETAADLLALAGAQAEMLEEAFAATLPPLDATLATRHLRGLIEGRGHEPLTGDSLAFAPLLALAAAPARPGHTGATALLLAEALRSRDAEGWFAITLWPERIDGWLALPPSEARAILGGLRHLYESDPDWSPKPERLASPQPDLPYPLLPVFDVSYGRADPGEHVG